MLSQLRRTSLLRVKILRNPGGIESPLVLSIFRPKREERRQKTRQKSRNLVAVESPERAIFNLVNISEGGIQYSSVDALRKSQIVNLIINLVEEGTQIEVLGKVVWCQPISNEEFPTYRIGISFVNLHAEAGTIIRHFIHESSRAA